MSLAWFSSAKDLPSDFASLNLRFDFTPRKTELISLSYLAVWDNNGVVKSRCLVSQKLLLEIEQPDKTWTPQEQDARGKFMRRLHNICSLLAIITFINVVVYICSPLFTNRMFPFNAVYPYPIKKLWVYCLTYIHSAITVQKIHIVVLLDLMITVVMWHAAFKFYLLGTRIRSVNTTEKLRASMIEYQNIIRYEQAILFFIAAVCPTRMVK